MTVDSQRSLGPRTRETGRQRLQGIFQGRSPGKPALTTIIDEPARSIMPKEVRSMGVLDFYRHIGFHILQFGSMGLRPGLRIKPPYRLARPGGVETEIRDGGDGTTTTVTHTPWGELTAVSKGGHPTEYPVRSHEDLRVFMRLWEESSYEEADGYEESYRRLEDAIGEDGVAVDTVRPSVVQSLLEYDMGMSAFYYLWQDHEAEMDALIALIHEKYKRMYEILAARSPLRVAIPVENTSTTMIGPSWYRRYSMCHIRDFVDIMHRHGKVAIIHMCGKLAGLLELFRETGMDGIHGLAQPPLGDIVLEQAFRALGDDLVVIAAFLDSHLLRHVDVSRAEIIDICERTVRPELMEGRNIVFNVPADGLPNRLEKFLVIREWMERYL